MAGHRTILTYGRYIWLKLGAGLIGLSCAAYAWHEPIGGPNGGSGLGYTFGVIGAGLIAWLTWFGVRKRQHGRSGAPLQAWLSAHVHLGLALAVIATLHTGFQFGLNIHTLAWGLMMATIGSGMFGVVAYLTLPRIQTANLRGRGLTDVLQEVASVDVELRRASRDADDELNRWVQHSDGHCKVGGGLITQLRGPRVPCANHEALTAIQVLVSNDRHLESQSVRQLLGLLSRKSRLLAQARREVQLRAWLRLWLFAHVPLTFALLVALAGHVLSVFFFW